MLGTLKLLLNQLEKEMVHAPKSCIIAVELESQGEVGVTCLKMQVPPSTWVE